jgi:hypothetical protein
MKILRIDVILWIFLQNIVLLPYDYLCETDEFSLFSQKIDMYIISVKDIYDKNIYGCENYIYTSFDAMLHNLQYLLPKQNKKHQLIKSCIPIIENIRTQQMFEKLSIKCM